MQQRTLEIKPRLCKGPTKRMNLISKMDVYAVVSLSSPHSHPKQKTRTPVDRDGGTNPTWNHPMKFTVYGGDAATYRGLSLVFNLRCDRALRDRDIGEVIVPVSELLDSVKDTDSLHFVSYQVRKPSGKPKGELYFSFRFGYSCDVVGDRKVVSNNKAYLNHQQNRELKPPIPVTAYPAPTVEPSSLPYGARGSYAPPPPGYGYPCPPPLPYGSYPPPPPPGYCYPPPGYGYPLPVQAGYGYTPVQQPQRRTSLEWASGLDC